MSSRVIWFFTQFRFQRLAPEIHFIIWIFNRPDSKTKQSDRSVWFGSVLRVGLVLLDLCPALIISKQKSCDELQVPSVTLKMVTILTFVDLLQKHIGLPWGQTQQERANIVLREIFPQSKCILLCSDFDVSGFHLIFSSIIM